MIHPASDKDRQKNIINMAKAASGGTFSQLSKLSGIPANTLRGWSGPNGKPLPRGLARYLYIIGRCPEAIEALNHETRAK